MRNVILFILCLLFSYLRTSYALPIEKIESIKIMKGVSNDYMEEGIPKESDVIDSLCQTLYQAPQVQENIYIHMDNQCYFLGDTLWYKAYVVRSDNMRPTNLSHILYVELLTPDGYLVERQQLCLNDDGGTNGQFVLTDSLYSGYYELRAYTKWQLNFNASEREHKIYDRHYFYNKRFEDEYFEAYDGLYSRVFPIYEKPVHKGDFSDKLFLPRPKQRIYTTSPKLNVKFYPEGGQLVKGIKSRIAFEVTDENGKALSLEGTMDDGNIIQPEHMGRGFFYYTPSDSEVSVSYTYASKKYKFKLPVPLDKGCICHYDYKNLTLELSANIQLGAISFSNRGRCMYFKRLETAEYMISIKDIHLPTGINEVVVYDRNAMPMLSRLIFIDNEDVGKEICLNHPKEISAYELSNITVDCSDSNKDLKTISLSIRDKSGDEATYNDGNILTELLLTSEIKGFVANPAFYFHKNKIAHPKELDLLLMVQGWRKYKRIEKGQYLPEKFLTYEGQILPISNNLSDDSDFKTSNNNWLSENIEESTDDKTEDCETFEADIDDENKDNLYENYDEQAKMHKKRIKKEVLVEAEMAINNEVFGEVQKTDKNGYFRFRLPEYYGNAILFLTAYNKKDSVRKSLVSRKDKTMMKGGYPDFYIKRNMFFPQFTNPYIWYQTNIPSVEDDRDYINHAISQGDINKVNILPTVKVKKFRKSKHSLVLKKPAMVKDAYKLYNDVVDYGLCQGVYNPYNFPQLASIFLFGYMGMAEDFNVRGMVDGCSYTRNYKAPRSEYDKSMTFAQLGKLMELRRIKNFRIYTDYDKRKDTRLERDGGADVTMMIESVPSDGTRYTYRDRRYVFQGYNEAMEFYSPDYSQYKPTSPSDYRRTLYWNPNAEIGEDGKLNISFFGNSHKCELSVTACGIGKSGQIYFTE